MHANSVSGVSAGVHHLYFKNTKNTIHM